MKLKNINSNNILISIISASYNCAHTIEKSILSIIPHLSESIEFIIIDGKSNDGTTDIIKKYENFISYWISEDDFGIYDAWNKGIKIARGKYISFIGLDDLLCNNYSKDFLQIINTNPNIDFVSSKMYIKKSDTIIFGDKWHWNNLRKQMNIVHPGSLHNHKLFKKYGLFDSSFTIAGDYEFLLRIGDNLKTIFINKPTVFFCLDGVSNNNSFKLAVEIRRAKLKNKIRSNIMINIEFITRCTIAILSKIKKQIIK